MKFRVMSAILIIVFAAVGFFVYNSEVDPDSRFAFKLGLDLDGGTELIYKADTAAVVETDLDDAVATLRDVIERRVNLFGVSEPVVQVEKAGLLSGHEEIRLIVELPGVTDVDEAVALIGETPLLEFALIPVPDNTLDPASGDIPLIPTALTGRYLERAQLDLAGGSGIGISEPMVLLQFNKEGQEIFAEITRNNIGETLAILLDRQIISAPVIREEIDGGSAQISGAFTPEEARELVRNLNYGALPVPIELISTSVVGPTLGLAALSAGVKAGLWGLALIIIFLILWYRLPGVIASVSLVIYVIISLALFKLIPVTLTAAGLAGFIISIGIAIDANILIFERLKEELAQGRSIKDSLETGFDRAWPSIRDSNTSSILTAIVLFWMGTSGIKGFALTFGIGVIVSMFTAITITRTFLRAMPEKGRKMFESGLGHKSVDK